MKKRLLFLLAFVLVLVWLSTRRGLSSPDDIGARASATEPEAWVLRALPAELQLPTQFADTSGMSHQMSHAPRYVDASSTGSIEGHVYAEDGITSLEGILVTIDGMALGDCTDSAGSYRLAGVPLNTPVIPMAAGTDYCGGPPEHYYAVERWREAVVRSDATEIVLSPSEPQRTDVDFTLEIGGVFSGKVYEADGSTPVGSYSWVHALDADGPAYVGPGGVESDGSYVTYGLPPGNYLTYAGAFGHEQVFFEHTSFPAAATVIHVDADSRVEGIDFALGLGGTITGKVFADDGVTPLPNVHAGLWDVGIYRNSWLGNCTDATGAYEILWVPYDTPFTIFAGGSDNWCAGGLDVYAKEWWKAVGLWAEASPVSISAARPHLTGIDFTLTQVGEVAGTVYEADGTTPTLPGPWIKIVDQTTEGLVATGHVAPGGSYVVRDVPVGTYLVAAAADGHALEFYEEAGPYLDAATPVEVSPSMDVLQDESVADVSGIDFTLDPGGAIRGTVFAEDGLIPLPNIAVGADGTWLRDCTDANGAYEIQHVPLEEPFMLFAGGRGWCAGSAGYYREWWEESDALEAAAAITVTTGQPELSGIDFTLKPLPPQAYLPLISSQQQ